MATRGLVLQALTRDDTGPLRLGFTVTKKVGNAVIRNRIKRQLREIVRGRLDSLPSSNDYVLVVRRGLPEAAETHGHEWLEARVDELLGKAAA